MHQALAVEAQVAAQPAGELEDCMSFRSVEMPSTTLRS
jgi:hypothetical protein